jgi:leucyl aminopeptidase
MKFTLQSGSYESKAQDCLIVGIFENNALSQTAKKLDKLSNGAFSKLLKVSDIQGKSTQTLFVYNIPGIKAERILLVGCGKQAALTERDFRKLIMTSIKAISTSKAKRVISFLTELDVENRDTAWKIKQSVEVSRSALYSFDDYKSTKAPKPSLEEIALAIPENKQAKDYQKALTQAVATANGMEFTKNLANQPSNVCNPTYVASEAKKFAKAYKNITVKVLEEKDMAKLGMGAFLSVTKGSAQDAKLVCLEYKGSSKAPLVLVGKGITFDTGGISLKPADAMVGMKYDMCGAATVLGVMKAVAELKLPIHLVGILALAENMPSGTASKPEDIVTTLSGQTVEIMNTDAEGRLVLCDALTYAERYKPDTVIDIATLTGAVVIALGTQATGLVSNYEPLANDLLAAGQETYDRAWQLPLWEEYQEQIKSPFADMSNTGGRMAGTITAGCFLSRFAKKFHWAHLDVAGTAAMMMGTSDRYATGRPVPLLVQYLINRVS